MLFDMIYLRFLWFIRMWAVCHFAYFLGKGLS